MTVVTAPPPPAARPRALRHGTIGEWNNGCRCPSCVGIAQAAAAAPPPTKKPVAAKRRAGRSWTVRCEPPGAIVGWAIYGAGPDHQLNDGEIVCQWTGTQGVLVTTEDTWRLIEQDDDAITVMQEAQEEAKAAMPKAVVRDVANGKPTVPRPVAEPGRRPRSPNPLTNMSAQIKALAEDMSRQTQPTIAMQAEFARRYGTLRDQMRQVREQVSEIEGGFEVVQEQIVRFLDG